MYTFIPFFAQNKHKDAKYCIFFNKTVIDPFINSFFHLTKGEHSYALLAFSMPYGFFLFLDIYVSCLQLSDK